MKVVIIGSGNVATVLGKKIFSAGHEILQIVSRSLHHAQTLAEELKSSASDNIKEINTDGDIYIISVTDNAIKETIENLPFTDKLIVHTAGAVSKNILKPALTFGVLYPLQSLRKEMQHMPEIPVLVDGSSEDVGKRLIEFASGFASSVSIMNDEKRLKMHVAAVFSSNFTNHIFSLAEEFCKNERIPFQHLLPLIKETISRLSLSSPSHLQTGPALRKDDLTMNKHLQVLQEYPDLKNLYTLLSHSIIKQHHQVVK